MNNSIEIYQKRINLAVEYINEHLNESNALNKLAEAAHFSPFHFHRIFKALLNETVNEFTNRVRLEKASRLLKYSESSISEIAFECGFSSVSTLSRAYKNYFEITPSQFRESGNLNNSKIGKQLINGNKYLDPTNLEQLKKQFPVEVVSFPERRVAYIRVHDSFRDGVVLDKFDKMVRWAKNLGIYEQETIFGMSLDDVMITPKDKFRYEVCITIPQNLVVEDGEILTMIMPACHYAISKVSGDIEVVSKAWNYLFNGWLLMNKYEPEHLPAVEIFLDKEKVCDWSHFELNLGIPVKELLKY